MNTNTTPAQTTGYFSYATYEDGESYYISEYSGSDMYVTIPTTYNGYPVRAIGSSAFSGNSVVRNIVLTPNIISIEEKAFYNCSNLKTISKTENLKQINASAFYGCSSLSTFEMYNSVVSIGENAFSGTATSINYYGSLTDWLCLSGKNNTSGNVHLFIDSNEEEMTTLEIPSNITTIDFSAFYGCVSLESVVFHDQVTSIKDKAFYNCRSLTSIVVPDSVTSIGSAAFGGCTGLTSITLPFIGGSSTITELGASTVFGYIFGDIFSSRLAKGTYHVTQTTYESDNASYKASCDLPISLTEVTITGGRIPFGAFDNCYYITKVSLPNGLTSIEERAFYNCNRLSSIVIPDSVISIGDISFLNCSLLTSLTIGEGVTSLGAYCFGDCTSLSSLTYNGTKAMWNSVTKGSGCFNNTSLSTINCTDGETTL